MLSEPELKKSLMQARLSVSVLEATLAPFPPSLRASKRCCNGEPACLYLDAGLQLKLCSISGEFKIMSALGKSAIFAGVSDIQFLSPQLSTAAQ